MKEIRIFQGGMSPIVILDDDKSKLDSYTKRISAVLEMGNVAIIQTSTGNVVVRPHKIESILVNEVQGSPSVEIQEAAPPEPEKKEEEHIDIITDGD